MWDSKEPQIKLLELHVQKISAIVRQDFEEAARYRDYIRNAENK
jgi:protein-arginine kinase activator protein McsA